MLLDWRLALDLLQLGTDTQNIFSPSLHDYWVPVVQRCALALSKVIPDGQVRSIGGLTCVTDNTHLHLVITHPFWLQDRHELKSLADSLSVGVTDLPTAGVFDAARRPGWVLTQTAGSIELSRVPTSAVDDNAIAIDELSATSPAEETFRVRMPDGRMNRIADQGDSLRFRRVGMVLPEELRSDIVILESPETPSKALIGQFDFFPQQNADGILTSVRMTLKAQSRQPTPSYRWQIPIKDWPQQFRPIAVLDK